MTLFFLAVIAAAAVAFVLHPVFAASPPGEGRSAVVDRPGGREALRLAERREQLLLALAELDFEKEAGKIVESEHATSRAALLAETAAVTARLDELLGRTSDNDRANQPPREPQ